MIKMYFGSPGCGKTTCAVREIVKSRKYEVKYNRRLSKFPWKYIYKIFPKFFYDEYYTNFETTVSKEVSLNGLGIWSPPPHTKLIIDESGIEYNNRKFKALSQDTIKWFKLHRHFRVDVSLYSQSFEDSDVTLRRLCNEYWYVRRLGPFTMLRKVRKFVWVNDDEKQIVDGYEFRPIIRNIFPFPFHEKTLEIFLRKPYYKYFDSFSVPLDVCIKK